MYRIIQVKDRYIVQKEVQETFLWWKTDTIYWRTEQGYGWDVSYDLIFPTVEKAEEYIQKELDYNNKPDFKVIKVIE